MGREKYSKCIRPSCYHQTKFQTQFCLLNFLTCLSTEYFVEIIQNKSLLTFTQGLQGWWNVPRKQHISFLCKMQFVANIIHKRYFEHHFWHLFKLSCKTAEANATLLCLGNKNSPGPWVQNTRYPQCGSAREFWPDTKGALQKLFMDLFP